MKKSTFDKILLGLLISFLLVSIFYWMKDKTISFTMFDKQLSPTDEIKMNELNALNNASLWFMDNINKTITGNEDLINKTNCKGLLYDQNNDNVYDSKILGVSFENNNNYVVHYNFCSFIWKKEKNISLILTSKVLMNDFVETKGDLIYIPSMVYKRNLNTGLEDTTFGLIDTRDIM